MIVQPSASAETPFSQCTQHSRGSWVSLGHSRRLARWSMAILPSLRVFGEESLSETDRRVRNPTMLTFIGREGSFSELQYYITWHWALHRGTMCARSCSNAHLYHQGWRKPWVCMRGGIFDRFCEVLWITLGMSPRKCLGAITFVRMTLGSKLLPASGRWSFQM